MKPKVYEGKENYIFVSYSHKDRDKVMPIIKRLQKDGCRIWYDEGIDAGSEWPETVATHLMECSLFLALLSKEYMDSFNCKREIDYAVSKRKSFIAVMLEDFSLSPGMEMQLAGVQFLSRHQLEEEEFFTRLYKTELIRSCIADKESAPENEAAAEEKETENRGDPEETAEKKRPRLFKKRSGSPTSGDKKKYSAKKIAAIVGGSIAAAGLLFLLGWNLTHITIAGTRYRFNEEFLTIKDAALTPDDTRKLSRFTNLGLLEFDNCDFTEDSENNLEKVKDGVRSFHLIGCKGVDDYRWLGGLRSVEWLEINNSGFDDKDVSEVWFLMMDNLVSIDLSDNKEFTNLGELAGCVNKDLKQIHLANTGVYSIAPLSRFEELSLIDISGCEVGSLEPLKTLQNVTYLAVDENNIENLNGIEGMTKIDTLSAAGNGLTSIDAIKDFVYLERIDLSNNKLTDISPLEKSKVKIKQLFLDNNEISDMSPISGLAAVQLLSLDGNGIEDLTFLEGSSEIQVLSARHNKIRSIEPLLDKQGITALYLSDNKITGDIVFGEKLGNWNTSITDESGPWDIQLQHNDISSLEFRGSSPWSLAVYDNPLDKLKGSAEVPDEADASELESGTAVFKSHGHTLVVEDFVETPERKGSLSGTYHAYLSWDTGSEEMLDIISCFDQYSSLSLSGCPLDLQAQVEEMMSSVNYTTEDEMDEILDAARSDKIDNYL